MRLRLSAKERGTAPKQNGRLATKRQVLNVVAAGLRLGDVPASFITSQR